MRAVRLTRGRLTAWGQECSEREKEADGACGTEAGRGAAAVRGMGHADTCAKRASASGCGRRRAGQQR